MTEIGQGVMNARETNLAEQVYDAVMNASRWSARGQQSAEFRVGISDLGYCSERTRRMLAQEVPDDIDLLPAWLGTVIGSGLEQAVGPAISGSVTQPEVALALLGDGGVYHITGHPDLVAPGLVIDFKTSRGLGVPRRNGPSQQQQFQRHCYAKACVESGLYADIPLDQWQVANVWLDRAADEREVHVQMEPFDPEVVEQATQWLDEVVWAFVHTQEARKEPAREVCAVTCGFYQDCRALDTDVSGLLSDDVVLTSVDMYREGLDLERTGARLKDQAKANLRGIQGSTGEYTVRWIHVNGGEVAYTRDSYEKLDVRKIK